MGAGKPIPDDPLGAFRDTTADDEGPAATRGEPLELLTFRFQNNLLAVRANAVAQVIGWRKPFPVPGGAAQVAGVVQDGGRIVVVLQHPAGIALPPKEPPSRIVVCDTKKGPVGLPAMETRAVTSVLVEGAPTGGDLLETADGVATYLDVEEIVDKVLRTGG